MLADVASGIHFSPEAPSVDAARQLITERRPDFFSFDDWKRLDAMEVERGEESGRPRVKFTTVDEMQAALGRSS